MISIPALWLPIVVSAVVVFLVSAVLHMVLKYHRSDYHGLPDEAAGLEALRKQSLRPGAYVLPYCASSKDMKSPEMLAKYNQGPVAILTVLPSGPPAMGKSLSLWFVYCLLVGLFTAYLAGRSVAAGAEYLSVFRFVGTLAFVGYGLGNFVDSVWKGQTWSVTAKMIFDGLLYALLTAGVFGWLWPR